MCLNREETVLLQFAQPPIIRLGDYSLIDPNLQPTYISRQYSLHVKSPQTAFVSAARYGAYCIVRIAASSRSLGGFSSLPPRHVIPCSLFRIVMVKSWGSGSRMVKDKKARIRIPCPFTGWILYPPPEATSTAKVDCILLNYGDDVILNARLPNTACKMQETAACEVEAKKTAVAFASYSCFFFFCLTCTARVDLQKDCKINMPKCLVMCEYVAVGSSRGC